MKDYTITVRATRGMEELTVAKIEIQEEELYGFDLGRVGNLYPLHQDTKISFDISYKEVETKE